MTARRSLRGGPVEVIEVLAWVPQTPRKALRVARVQQSGVELIELRLCGLDPEWQPSPLDHRTVIRAPAVGRVIAALQAAVAKTGDGK